LVLFSCRPAGRLTYWLTVFLAFKSIFAEEDSVTINGGNLFLERMSERGPETEKAEMTRPERERKKDNMKEIGK